MRDAWRRLADERDTLLAENGVSLFFPRNASPLLIFAQDMNRKTLEIVTTMMSEGKGICQRQTTEWFGGQAAASWWRSQGN